MKFSPCLSPVSVFNESLGTTVSVPCGHCDACVSQKGFRRKLKIEEQFLRFKFRFFITLTFADVNLPKAHFDDAFTVMSDIDKDYLGRYVKASLNDYSDEDYKFVVGSVKKFGFLPVLSRTEISKFKKRLRYYITKNYGTTRLYLYSAGEYGPTTYRPHFHVLAAFDDERLVSCFQQLVNQAWAPGYASGYRSKDGTFKRALGDVDFQRCYDGGAENYCAQYLSCSTHLPRIYREYPFAPFSSQSTDVGFADRQHLPSLRDAFFRLDVTFTYVSPKRTDEILLPLPSSYVRQLFPRCPAYCKIDERCLFGVYNTYRQYAGKFSKSTAREFAKSIIDSYRLGAFVSKDIKYLYMLYDFKNTPIDTLSRKLVSLYYCSRRVCLNCLEFGVTLDFYLKQMVGFYSKFELKRLSDFYEFQEDLLSDFYHPATVSSLFGLYKSTDYQNLKHLNYYLDQFGCNKVSDFDPPACHHEYISLCHKIVSDTTKTKKRNDVFDHRGLSRPKYVPTLKRNLLRFKSI